MSITIQDIAFKSKVGKTTVSDILNRNRTDIYSSKTVEKVQKVARELGYTSNKFAQTMRTGRTNIIGVTHGSPVPLHRSFTQPYLAQVYAGLGRELEDREHDLLFQNMGAIARKTRGALDLAESRFVDGLVFVHMAHAHRIFLQEYLPLLVKLPVPVVIVHSTGNSVPLPHVGLDCVAGAEKAVNHLLDHGYGTVGFVGVKGTMPVYEDLRTGYANALRARNIDVDERFVFTTDKIYADDGVALAHKLAADKGALPRALLVCEDFLAQGLLKGFAEAGVRVPEDVALVGYGDLNLPWYMPSGLTSVIQPAFDKGRLAMRILLDAVEKGSNLDGLQEVILSPALRVRTSCGCDEPETKIGY